MSVRIYQSLSRHSVHNEDLKDVIDAGIGEPEVRFTAEFDYELGEFRLLIDGECVYSDLRPDAA